MLLQLLLFIVVLNIVYVFGHFLFAILLKVKEAHYFLGYNPRLFSFRIKDTQFTIGLYIPIVGLARIYTIVDGEKQRAKYPWEFFEHSIGRRLLVTFGGAIALFVFGLLVPIIMNYFHTVQVITKEEVNRHGIYPSPRAREWGFQNGDKIMAVNGKDYDDFDDLLRPNEIVNPNTYYTVERNGKTIDIKPVDLIENIHEDNQLFISLYAPFEIEMVLPESPAEAAGILPGDRITKVNGQSIVKSIEMTEAFKNDEDGMVSLELQRAEPDGAKIWSINIALDSGKKIGVAPRELIQYTERKNTLFEAVQKGTYLSFKRAYSIISTSTGLITRNVSRPIGGPIAINSRGTIFWGLTAFYAMWYALWNLFPLPKAAFWEVIALVYERISRKKYSYSAFIKTLNWSWVIPMGLMIWIFVGDILRILFTS